VADDAGEVGDSGGSGDAGDGGRGEAGEDGRNGDPGEEARGDTGEGGASMALWFVIPSQTTLANRDARPGVLEEASAEGVSVSSPSSGDSSSDFSDNSGEECEEAFWLVMPFQKVSRRREPSVALAFAFDSSSLRLLSSTAVWRMLSMPPADSMGYPWRSPIPSVKASLSSHARNGDGGPSNKFSSAQRLGACRTVFPRLGNSQQETRGAIISWRTEKVDLLHGSTY
jgi:hypothetical protein